MAQPPKPPFDLPPPEFEVHDPLVREAVAWIVHLTSGRDRPEDWLAFDQWQAASPAHKRAAEEARLLWEQTGPSLLALRKSRVPKASIVVAAFVGLSALGFFGGLFGPPE